MSKSSPIWSFFIELPEEKARCKINKCPAIVSRKGGTTKSMWDHLKGLHKDIHEKLKNPKQDEKQEAITSFVTVKKNEQDEADELIASIMLRRNEAFPFVEDPGIKFCLFLNKSYLSERFFSHILVCSSFLVKILYACYFFI